MRNRNHLLSAARVLIALGAAIAIAPRAAAQDSSERLLDRHVTVKVETARLGPSLKTLMTSLGANYTISNDIKDAVVTADLADVPLKIALEAIGRASTVPMTYTLENGIFFFTAKVNDGDIDPIALASGPPVKAAPPEPEVVAIHLDYSDAGEIAKIFGGVSVQVSFQNFGIFGFGNSGRGSGSGGFNPGGLSGSGSGSSTTGSTGGQGFGLNGSSGSGSIFSNQSGFGQPSGPTSPGVNR